MTPRTRLQAVSLALLCLCACGPAPRLKRRPLHSAPASDWQPRPAAPESRPAQQPSAEPVPAPPAQAQAAAPGPSPCFNTQYRFTCELPRGFVVTQEGEGPGVILSLSPQSADYRESASLSVQAGPLEAGGAEGCADRLVQELLASKGIGRWEKNPVRRGLYEGVEVYAERSYASGLFKSRTFCFYRGADLFQATYSAPAEQYDRYPDALERFLDSLKFQP